ncbi:MAG: hypothetical protein ACYSU0_22095, partial [Planctomycetota bacterium]
TYTPTGDGDRTKSFVMKDGVDIYGGFAGTESLRNQRNWTTNVTILSGDLDGDDDPTKALDDPLRNNSENSFHVVIGASNATFDGFRVEGGRTISGGMAGGGMANSLVTGLTVTNCTFTGNCGQCYGGGMCNDWSLVEVINCTFTNNLAWAIPEGLGGGVYSRTGFVVFTDCTFTDNSAHRGGGMRNSMCDAWVTNCVFTGNSAEERGGGMYNTNCDPVLTNCTFSGNNAGSWGGAIYNDGALATITNCILWGNVAPTGTQIYDYTSSCSVKYSNVQGGWAGAGNIGELAGHDPLFVDPGYWDDNVLIGDPSDDIWVDGDYHLQAGSPCIDAADGDAAPLVDMDGLLRYDDPGVEPNTGIGTPDYADMGAHEFGGSATGTVTGTVFLNYNANPAEVTITAGGQTATVTVVSDTIEYTIYNVPSICAEVIVETTESGCTVTGSPAAIAWVGATGAAAGVTVSLPAPPDYPRPLANDGSGCTSAPGGRDSGAAGWALAAVAALAVLALRRLRAAGSLSR